MLDAEPTTKDTTMTTAPLATKSTVPPGEIVGMDKPAPSGKTIMDIMMRMSERLAAVATKHLTAEKLIRMIGVQMARNPKLGRCTPISVLDCAMTCSELGLAPGVLGDAYLIPYKEVCTLIVGYRGLMKLARRSGEIATIQAEVVRKGDTFNHRLGVDPTINHEPIADYDQPITHAWAMAKFKDGSYQFCVLNRMEIDAIRKRSRASGDGPWVTDFPEMAKKTALRRLCKMLPLTTEIEQAIADTDKSEFDFNDLGMSLGELPEGRSSFREPVNTDTGEVEEGQGGTPTGEMAREMVAKKGDTIKERRAEMEKADAQRERTGCRQDLIGCSQDPAAYSAGPDGKMRCINHAFGSPEETTADPEQPQRSAAEVKADLQRAKVGCRVGAPGCDSESIRVHKKGELPRCKNHPAVDVTA